MPSSTLLELINVSVGYADRTVLHDISLAVNAGEVFVVIGPNGAGKTTLIRAVSGMVPVHSGRILVGGADLAGMSISERAKIMAVVPQARNLPPAFTGQEMVLLGRTARMNWLGQASPSDKEIVQRVMQQTDTSALGDRRLGELSGGEQQRLLLARALAQQSTILLLDEPFTHLDLHYQVSLLEQMRRIAFEQNLGVLAVLHDLNMAAYFADRAALLIDGQIRAIGTPSEVLIPSLLSEAYSLPLDVFRQFSPGEPVFIPSFQNGFH